MYIGLDLGTSGLKGIALDARGEVVARASAEYPTSRPSPHAAQQDPADWIAALDRVTARLRQLADPGRWHTIGLSAMLPTLVTTGADGQPLGPAITWEDSRAEAEGTWLRETRGASQLYWMTGQVVDGRYLLPMAIRLAGAEPDRVAGTKMVMGAKDYLFGLLTGTFATDPSTATGFGCYRLADGLWDDATLELAARRGAPIGHLTRPALPPVLPSVTTLPLRPEWATRLGCGQIPVCLGAADSVLGVYGLGLGRPGDIGYVAGTSTVILGVTDRLLLDPDRRFLVTPMAESGQWGLEMDLLATGSSLRWLANLLGEGLTEADLIMMASRCDPAQAPVMLPFLSPGEQGALWDPLLRGTITGLTLGHDRQHLARSLVNGIVLESRRCLSVLDETAEFSGDILVAGGSANAAAFRADLADATGRRVITPSGEQTDFSARGAALLAARAIGPMRRADMEDPAGTRDPAGAPDSCGAVIPSPAGTAGEAPRISEPDPARAAIWASLWNSHERTRLAITSHYHG